MMIDLKADFHGHVIDYVGDQDRAFFAAHPEVQAFERPAFPHEFCNLLAGGGPQVCFDFEGVVVRVTRMVDGARTRQPLWAGMILPRIPPRS